MKVAAGFCYGQSTQTPQWSRSYRHVVMHNAATSHPIVCEFAREASGVHIGDARSKIVREFLDHPARLDWLWMVDTDATFEPDVLERLIAAADARDRPIVGALAFGVVNEGDGFIGPDRTDLFPTLYFYDESGTIRFDDYLPDQLVQVHATGAHCILIHRRVLSDSRWKDGHPSPWFRTATRAGELVSEDQFFCTKAGALGYPVFVHTGIKTGHVKTFIADERRYLADRAGRMSPEPWIVVPSGYRDQYLPGIVAAAPGRTVIVNTAARTAERGLDAVEVNDLDEVNIQRWWNRGLNAAAARGARYVAVVNDDVTLDHEALVAMRDALVATGATACYPHPEGRMCGWTYMLDLSHGVRPDESYRWWFGDNDLDLRARARGGVIGVECNVVHHHPNETTEADPALQRLAEADRRLFHRRWPQVQLRAS